MNQILDELEGTNPTIRLTGSSRQLESRVKGRSSGPCKVYWPKLSRDWVYGLLRTFFVSTSTMTNSGTIPDHCMPALCMQCDLFTPSSLHAAVEQKFLARSPLSLSDNRYRGTSAVTRKHLVCQDLQGRYEFCTSYNVPWRSREVIQPLLITRTPIRLSQFLYQRPHHAACHQLGRQPGPQPADKIPGQSQEKL